MAETTGIPETTALPQHYEAGGRWTQLTYASFDSGSGSSGGWQVKDVTGDPDGSAVEALRREVVTSFDHHGKVPDFPSAAEIAALPRRFAYRPLPGGESAVLVHAVMAGNDSTGRPGNIYSHVARVDEPTGTWRPTDLWRSPVFATPYGVRSVLATEIGPDPTDHPGVVPGDQGEGAGVPAAYQRMKDPSRHDLLAALLDGLQQAVRTGVPVVLACDDQDAAADLLGTALTLTSPRVARRIGFSLYERASALPRLVGSGLHLVVVPEAEAGAAAEDGRFTVLTRESGSSAAGTGSWARTFRGLVVDLGVLWEVVWRLLTEDTTLAAEDLDGLDPAWPMAMSVRRSPVSGDVRDLVGATVRESAPPSAEASRDHSALLGAAIAEVSGASPAEKWEELSGLAARGGAGGLDYALRADQYVAAALRSVHDSAWLPVHLDRVPDPARRATTERDTVDRVAEGVLTGLLGEAGTLPDPGLGVRVLATVDFLIRCGIVDPSRVHPATEEPGARLDADPIGVRIEELLASSAVRVLARNPEALAEDPAGRIGTDTRALVLRAMNQAPWTTADLRPSLDAPAAATTLLDWVLGADPWPAPVARAWRSERVDLGPADFLVAVRRRLRTGEDSADSTLFVHLPRYVGDFGTLRADGAYSTLVDGLRPSLTAFLDLQDHHPGWLGDCGARQWLFTHRAWEDRLDRLIGSVGPEARYDQGVAYLRRGAHAVVASGRASMDPVSLLDWAAWTSDNCEPAPVVLRELAPAVLAAGFSLIAVGGPLGPAPSAQVHTPNFVPDPAGLLRLLTTCARAGVDTGALVAAGRAYIGVPGLMDSALVTLVLVEDEGMTKDGRIPEELERVVGLGPAEGDGRTPFVHSVLTTLIEDSDRKETETRVVEQAWAIACRILGDDPADETEFKRFRKEALRTLAGLRSRGRGVFGRLTGGARRSTDREA
ncbi:hypothetical protein [Brevibacterium litoralis]|uniref:GAP1-N2 domain-containing protein n=1 Tax=Brevibacterium litoralis TaxID=3138935 RepID=UPI0032EF296B